MVVLEKRFSHLSLTRKILYKFAVYLILMLLIISVAYPIAASLNAGSPIYDLEI